MKKIIAILTLCFFASMLSGCGNDKTIDGKNYPVYGLANAEAMQDPNVTYQISFGSVIVAVLLFETIIVPIYVLGWDLYEPVRLKRADEK